MTDQTPEPLSFHVEPRKVRALCSATRNLAFIVESMAHLQGMEHDLLPYAELGRKLASECEG
jgi:hypothetical protein